MILLLQGLVLPDPRLPYQSQLLWKMAVDQSRQFRRLEGYLREQRREQLLSKHVRMKLEEENQVIKWRGEHQKGLR